MESRMIRLNAWETICMQLVNRVMNHRDAWPFEEPVDPHKWDVPDYFEVIKEPMDLSTMKNQLAAKQYQHFSQVLDHLLLVFDNAMKYNPPYNPVYLLAERMQKSAAKSAQQLLPKLSAAANAAGGARPLPAAPPPHRTAASRPLAPIYPFSPERLLVTLHRINTLAPGKPPAGGAEGLGLGGVLDGKPAAQQGRRRRRGADGHGGDSDDGPEASSGGNGLNPTADGADGAADGSSAPPPPAAAPIPLAVLVEAKGLPDLPQGFYLASPRPATRFLSMPSRANGGQFSVERFVPQAMPSWPQHERRWREIQVHQAFTPGRKLQRKAKPALPAATKPATATQPQQQPAAQGPAAQAESPCRVQQPGGKEQREQYRTVLVGVDVDFESNQSNPDRPVRKLAEGGGKQGSGAAGAISQTVFSNQEQQQQQAGKLASAPGASPSPPGSSLDVGALELSIATFADAKAAFDGGPLDPAASPFFLDMETSNSPPRGLPPANCWSGSNSSSRGQPPSSWGALQPDLPPGCAAGPQGPPELEGRRGPQGPEEEVVGRPSFPMPSDTEAGGGGEFRVGRGHRAGGGQFTVAGPGGEVAGMLSLGGQVLQLPMVGAAPRIVCEALQAGGGGSLAPGTHLAPTRYMELSSRQEDPGQRGGGGRAGAAAKAAADAADVAQAFSNGDDLGVDRGCFLRSDSRLHSGSLPTPQPAAGSTEAPQPAVSVQGLEHSLGSRPSSELLRLQNENEQLRGELHYAHELIARLQDQLAALEPPQQQQQYGGQQYGNGQQYGQLGSMRLLQHGQAVSGGGGLVLVPVQSLQQFPLQQAQLALPQQQQHGQGQGGQQQQLVRPLSVSSMSMDSWRGASQHSLLAKYPGAVANEELGYW